MRIPVSCLVLFLTLSLGEAAAIPVAASPQSGTISANDGQLPANTRGTRETGAEAGQPGSLPDSPGAVEAQAVNQSNQPIEGQATSASQQDSTPPPVGTAAAPYVKTNGVSASRPAGAAIAPAKQRRIRSIAIRVGLLVGAGVAIGTVVAASAGSSSRPH
jgi:hypothetical protein